ncbi:MAG: response regulator, partial [Gammaproteobacteria bacterium]|nr:response regulator [Gammaproteobacteria bacterium]
MPVAIDSSTARRSARRPVAPGCVVGKRRDLAPGRSQVAANSVKEKRIVIVDDDPTVLEVLSVHLEDAGFRHLVLIEDSTRAMDMLRAAHPDVLLTDLRMPRVSGFDLLQEVRADPDLGYLPVVMLTSDSDAETRLKALDLGVTDFLGKPIDPSELVLRLRNNLVVKAYQDQLAAARRESDRLLRNILPEPVANRLKRGESVADHFDEATVLFADLVDFTRLASSLEVGEVLRQLNEVFGHFDHLVEARGLEKIKTIGDAYMLAAGVPTPRPDHVYAVIEAGLAMLEACEQLRARFRSDLRVRIGIHLGDVLRRGGEVIGEGVNVAARVRPLAEPGGICVSEPVYQMVRSRSHVTARSLGARALKNVGQPLPVYS